MTREHAGAQGGKKTDLNSTSRYLSALSGFVLSGFHANGRVGVAKGKRRDWFSCGNAVFLSHSTAVCVCVCACIVTALLLRSLSPSCLSLPSEGHGYDGCWWAHPCLTLPCPALRPAGALSINKSLCIIHTVDGAHDCAVASLRTSCTVSPPSSTLDCPADSVYAPGCSRSTKSSLHSVPHIKHARDCMRARSQTGYSSTRQTRKQANN